MDIKKDSSKKKTRKRKSDNNLDFKTIFRERDPESSFILFIVPVILIIWVYYGKQADFNQLFNGFYGQWNLDFYSTIYEYLTAFILMFWIPYFIVKIIFKKRVKDFGFQIGDFRYGYRFILPALVIVFWGVYVASSKMPIQAEYPMAKSTIGYLVPFVIVEFFYLFYYFGWEFLFRGFMLFGLKKQYGILTAILIQTIPSALIHIGKPAGESIGAILAGLVFGYLAVRTKSFFYPFILHAAIGICTDLFVTFRLL